MFPIFTEEFPVYQLIGLSKSGDFKEYDFYTYSYNNVEKMNTNFKEDDYNIRERNDTLRVYLKLYNDLLLSDLYFDSNEKLKLSLDEEQVNHETASIQNLQIERKSPKKIVLLSKTDPTSEYILSKITKKYYLSGSSIYLLNPPNEKYEMSKTDI